MAPAVMTPSRRAIVAAIGLSVAGVAAFSVLPVMVGILTDSHGLGASLAGYVASADLAGFALTALAAAFWVVRCRWRRAAIVGLSALVIGNLLSLGTPGFAQLLIARLLAGIGAGTVYSVAMSTLARCRDTDRAFGLMIAAQVIFQVIALFVLPRLVAVWGPSALFLTLGGVSVLASVGITQLPDFIEGSSEPPTTMLATRSAWLALAGVALFTLNLGALWTYIERMGVSAGLSSPQVGSMLAAALAISVLGALGASRLGDRFGRRLPLVVAMAGQLVALVLMTENASAVAFAIGATLYSLAWAFAMPYFYGFVASHDPGGRLIVLAPAVQAIGVSLGPLLAASMLRGDPYLLVNCLAAVALLGAVACVLSATPRERLQLTP